MSAVVVSERNVLDEVREGHFGLNFYAGLDLNTEEGIQKSARSCRGRWKRCSTKVAGPKLKWILALLLFPEPREIRVLAELCQSKTLYLMLDKELKRF